jgi:hypothetical protein
MYLKSLGFVTLKAIDVVDLAKALMEQKREERAVHREEYIQNFMQPRKFLFVFNRRPRTREEALDAIHDDFFTAFDFSFYDEDYRSDQERSLQKLIDVGTSLLDNSSTATMQVAIEAADWLCPSV